MHSATGFDFPGALPDRRARIFLLSHMHACTSLAGHNLGSLYSSMSAELRDIGDVGTDAKAVRRRIVARQRSAE